MVLVLAIECQRAQSSRSRNPFMSLISKIITLLHKILRVNLSLLPVTKLTLSIIMKANICAHSLKINLLVKGKVGQLHTYTMQMKTDHRKITIS